MTVHTMTPYDLEPFPTLTPEQLALFEKRQGQWEYYLSLLAEVTPRLSEKALQGEEVWFWDYWEGEDKVKYRALDPLCAAEEKR